MKIILDNNQLHDWANMPENDLALERGLTIELIDRHLDIPNVRFEIGGVMFEIPGKEFVDTMSGIAAVLKDREG